MTPQPDKIILFTDGASRGNPGLAAIGYVVYLHFPSGAEKVLKKCGNFLGTTTNNQAEYQALIQALTWLIKNNYQHLPLDIYLDSLLLVNQVKGKYKVKNSRLFPLYQQLTSLLSQFPKFNITHVSRSHNQVADSLANQALDNLSSSPS